MNKKVTQILSLAFLILTLVGFGIAKTQKISSNEDKSNDWDVNPYELAALTINDSSELLKNENPTVKEINAINTKLLALEDEVEVLNENAKTSYYHEKFVGRKTASGEVFSNKKYTAAHKTLPFGSKVRVTNNVNDESVIVTINDRGPHLKSRQLDLSKQAYLDITHNKHAGVLNVKIEVLPDDYEDIKLELEDNLDEFIL